MKKEVEATTPLEEAVTPPLEDVPATVPLEMRTCEYICILVFIYE